MSSRAMNWAAGVMSPVTGYALAHLIYTHERALGLYCPPRECGPDDLPMWIFLGTWLVAYSAYRALRNWR